ncbi:DUF4919 domain-containing protein [Flavobacterium rhizosphaerae]|uniref:DUF4919 domain-containing protein n=1 Tax=Flavobacterium rhizosphaerae TaxID=3163298 RepID=A0ABW8YX92_9FLAO
MKKIILLLLLLCPLCIFAQDFTKPDYKTIEKNIKDKNSPYFFEKLFDRFTKADTTMTLEEKRHVYYGYSFTDAYSPYSTPDAKDELNKLMDKENLDDTEKEKALGLIDKVLKEDPFSLQMLNYKLFFYEELNRNKEAEDTANKMGMILDAILSTGDGTSIENCFYVITVGNEYEVISIIGFEFGGKQSLIENKYDYLELAENAYGIEGFYFDISRSINSMKF